MAPIKILGVADPCIKEPHTHQYRKGHPMKAETHARLMEGLRRHYAARKAVTTK